MFLVAVWYGSVARKGVRELKPGGELGMVHLCLWQVWGDGLEKYLMETPDLLASWK